MDFGLSEEQELLQETVRGFVERECPPARLRELFDEGAGHDPALWKGLAEMGLTGLIIPEEYGGAGMEVLDLALVCEVLGEGGLPGPFLPHSLAALALSERGSPEQKEKWLPAMALGEKIATVAFCEEGGAWDLEGWACQLGDGLVQMARISNRRRCGYPW